MKKITFSEAVSRFADRTDIELCENGFTGWQRTKSKFYDKITGEYFWARADNVYRKKTSHPKRSRKKSAKIRSISFEQANERFSTRGDVKLLKEGYASFNKKAKFFDEIIGEYFWATPDSVLRQNSCHPKRGLEKRKKTLLKKYGVDVFTKSQIYKDEYRYNSCTIKLADGRIFKKWYDKQPPPKPAYSTVVNYFKHKDYNIDELNQFFANYKSNKTQLEVFFEQLFMVSHFNKAPNNKIKYRPDFILSLNIFVNTDGIWWHREDKVGRNYHFNLRKKFEENGLRIFQFYEHEIYQKTDVIKSIVNNSLGKTKNRIFARKCKIKSVKQLEASHFLDENHLMGSTNAKHLGLFFENKLVSLLSYKQRKNICKIERFCSIVDTNVVGGFSKLLSHLKQNYLKPEITEIHNWVDLRYGTGEHLKNKGFEQLKETLGWKWTDNLITFNRLKCRANMDDRKLTQQQHADELGWVKIYDAGQRLWVRKIS